MQRDVKEKEAICIFSLLHNRNYEVDPQPTTVTVLMDEGFCFPTKEQVFLNLNPYFFKATAPLFLR